MLRTYPLQKRISSKLLLGLGIAALALMGVARAQEMGDANLKLSTTTIKANNQTLSLSSTQVAAFSGTDLTCPSAHTQGCTIKIEVSSQFSNVPAGATAQLNVSLNGNLFAVSPTSLVNVATGRTTTTTFQWVVFGVTAGSQRRLAIGHLRIRLAIRSSFRLKLTC